MNAIVEKLQVNRPGQMPDSILSALIASERDFFWFGGNGSEWTIVPLGLAAQESKAFFQRSLLPEENGENNTETVLPFTGGFVGIIPYDTFSPFSDGPSAKIFSAHGALLLNNLSLETFVAASDQECFPQVLAEAKELITVSVQIAQTPPKDKRVHGIKLKAKESDDLYERMVENALEDIRNGRFYQINLLRYYSCSNLTRSAIGSLLSNRGGPFSCWFHSEGTDVISFSPEQFVAVRQQEHRYIVDTSPIKGTAARSSDPVEDVRAAEELQHSGKNLAELHMIVDLMRNDLNRICKPGSVKVGEHNKLVSFVNVHHLVASVAGELRPNIRIGNFLECLCPGGSITGAPKIEVMHAIREFERRPRGYFMGHAFMLDSTGRFDSSVLIRTLTGSAGNEYEFSAGSGIVIHSDPTAERLEIDAKCNVLRP